MNKDAKIKCEILELSKLHLELEKRGGFTKDGNLFEKILSKQDEILIQFGLPLNQDNYNLFWFKKEPTDYEIEKIIKQFHNKASVYLKSTPKGEIEFLKEAQENKFDAFIVLPELKIPTHVYTIYVYNSILLKKKDKIENILLEFKVVNNDEMLNAIGVLEQNYVQPSGDIYSKDELNNSEAIASVWVKIDGEEKYLLPDEIISILNGKGLKYLDRFIVSLSNLINDEDY